MNSIIGKSLTRRSVLLGSAAAGSLAIAGLPRSAIAAPEVSNVKITQAVTSLAFIQNYLAKELGYFADEGLQAEIIETRGGGPDVQAVLAGDAAFTVNDGAQVLPAVAKGQRLTCVLATLDRNIINVSMRAEMADKLGVSEDSPIDDKLKALTGLKIGITRPGALTWQLARFNLAKAGLNPDRDATIVGLGGGAAVAAGLENGEVDVIYISVPLGERVVKTGEAIPLIDNASGEDPYLPSFIMEGLWAKPAFVEENPNTVRAAVRALRRASDFTRERGTEEIVKALKAPLGGLGMDVLTIGVEKVKNAVSKSGRFDQAILDNTQDVLELSGVIDKRFDIAAIFDGRFLA